MSNAKASRRPRIGSGGEVRDASRITSPAARYVRPSFGFGSITLCSFNDASEHTEAFFLCIGHIARVVRAENFLEGAQQSIAKWRGMFGPRAIANVLGREIFDGMNNFLWLVQRAHRACGSMCRQERLHRFDGAVVVEIDMGAGGEAHHALGLVGECKQTFAEADGHHAVALAVQHQD